MDAQRSFIHDLAQKLYITKPEDWFHVTTSKISLHGGTGLMSKYGDSISKLLTAVCPEYKKACRDFVMRIKEDLNLSRVEDMLTVQHSYHNTLICSAYSSVTLKLEVHSYCVSMIIRFSDVRQVS